MVGYAKLSLETVVWLNELGTDLQVYSSGLSFCFGSVALFYLYESVSNLAWSVLGVI